MAKYFYRVRDSSGGVKTGVIESGDHRLAREELVSAGWRVETLSPADPGEKATPIPRPGNLKVDFQEVFTPQAPSEAELQKAQEEQQKTAGRSALQDALNQALQQKLDPSARTVKMKAPELTPPPDPAASKTVRMATPPEVSRRPPEPDPSKTVRMTSAPSRGGTSSGEIRGARGAAAPVAGSGTGTGAAGPVTRAAAGRGTTAPEALVRRPQPPAPAGWGPARIGLVAGLILVGAVVAILYARPSGYRAGGGSSTAQASATPVNLQVQVRGRIQLADAPGTPPSDVRVTVHLPDIPLDVTRKGEELALSGNGEYVIMLDFQSARTPSALEVTVGCPGYKEAQVKDMVLQGGNPRTGIVPLVTLRRPQG